MPAAAAAPAAGAIMLFCFFWAHGLFEAVARGAAAVISSLPFGLVIDNVLAPCPRGMRRLPPSTFLPRELIPSVLPASSNHETIFGRRMRREA